MEEREINDIDWMTSWVLFQIYFSVIPISQKRGWEALKAAGMQWVLLFIENFCGLEKYLGTH